MAKDPTIEDMREFLNGQFSKLVDIESAEWEFDREEAIYWFSYCWHSGQWSNLYSALSVSEFRPSPLANGPERGTLSEILYSELETEFTK
jgi:hypothetical protein